MEDTKHYLDYGVLYLNYVNEDRWVLWSEDLNVNQFVRSGYPWNHDAQSSAEAQHVLALAWDLAGLGGRPVLGQVEESGYKVTQGKEDTQ